MRAERIEMRNHAKDGMKIIDLMLEKPDADSKHLTYIVTRNEK